MIFRSTSRRREYEKFVYPFSWLGIFCQTPPLRDELVYEFRETFEFNVGAEGFCEWNSNVEFASRGAQYSR